MMDWNKLEIYKQVCPAGSPEGVKFDLFPFGFFLLLRYSDPDGSIRRNVKQGHPSFRAIRAGDFLVFLCRFGAMHWQASVLHISEAQSKRIPQPWTGRGLPLHILFVDAVSGKVRAKKVLEMDQEVSRRIVSILSAQDENDPLLNRDILVRRIFQEHSVAQLATIAKLQEQVPEITPKWCRP